MSLKGHVPSSLIFPTPQPSATTPIIWGPSPQHMSFREHSGTKSEHIVSQQDGRRAQSSTRSRAWWVCCPSSDCDLQSWETANIWKNGRLFYVRGCFCRWKGAVGPSEAQNAEHHPLTCEHHPLTCRGVFDDRQAWHSQLLLPLCRTPVEASCISARDLNRKRSSSWVPLQHATTQLGPSSLGFRIFSVDDCVACTFFSLDTSFLLGSSGNWLSDLRQDVVYRSALEATAY